jgi:hypothetical protein
VECRTMVAIPPRLISVDELERPLPQFDLHFLSNPDPHLHFAPPTASDDAPQKHMRANHALVEKAEARIQDLNRRYGQEPSGCFLSLLPGGQV